MWQGGDSLWEASTYKVIRPFKDVVFWDHVTNLHYHSTMPEAIKVSNLETYSEALPIINLIGHINKLLCEVR